MVAILSIFELIFTEYPCVPGTVQSVLQTASLFTIVAPLESQCYLINEGIRDLGGLQGLLEGT